jgi:hypothetical protein
MNWRKVWKQQLKTTLGVGRVADLPTSVLIWRGTSQLNGDDIMVVASRVREASENTKTGDMVQVYILPVAVSPRSAWHHGGIEAVCPDACSHRSDQDADCYVNWSRLRSTWERGAAMTAGVPAGFFRGAVVRFGAGGDPSAVPFEVWKSIADEARGWSGYTANWRSLSPEWATLFMASVSSLPDVWRARSAGWRIYAASESAAMDDALSAAGIRECLSHSHGVECTACRQCDGTSKGSKRPDYYIPLHGAVGGKRRRQADSA